MDRSRKKLAYSAVLPAAAIQAWEGEVERFLTESEESTQAPAQLANAVVTHILATSHFARRAKRLSPAQVRQLQERVGNLLSALRIVFLTVAPEYLELLYRDSLSQSEQRRMKRLQGTVKRQLRGK